MYSLIRKNRANNLSIFSFKKSFLARRASQKAIKEAFAAGIAIHSISDGKLIREYPDGRKGCLKKPTCHKINLNITRD